MWTTRVVSSASLDGDDDVILTGDNLAFRISIADWWIMSATEHLANKALRENDLDFKISEIYGTHDAEENPLWTTELVPAGDSYDVRLMRDSGMVATMSLDEWAGLSATAYIVQDAVEVAEGLAPYGRNIEEVREHIAEEEAFEETDIDDPDFEVEPRSGGKT